jgi:MoaA/NifB/PqqE/SkfB family radical SAM enzyme
MTRQTMEKIVRFLDAHDDITADVTGGAPEMNPDFKYLMERLCVSGRRVLIRTNLAVFFELMLEWVPRWYSDHNVVVIASLPCYTKGNVDSQRGQGVFDKSIRSLGIFFEADVSPGNNLFKLKLSKLVLSSIFSSTSQTEV